MSPLAVSPRARVAVLSAILVIVLIAVLIALRPQPSPGPTVPALSPYVNDLTDPPTLLQSEADALDAMCWELDQDTTAEFAILVVNTTQPWGIDAYAADTFQANGIGKAGKDNGALLVISMDERQWRIEVGYGLEEVLNDARVGRIGRAFLEPNLTAGGYYEGLRATTAAIGEEIYRGYDPGAPVQSPRAAWATVCIPAILLFFLAALVIGVATVLYVRKHPGFAARLSTGSGGGTVTQSQTQPSYNFGSSSSRESFGGGRSGGGGARGKF